MNRPPISTERAVFISWALFCLSTVAMAGSSKGWLALLWSIYGSRSWPVLTDVYLSSVYWFWVPPALAALIIGVLWRRGILERTGTTVQVGLHAGSIGVFVFSGFAAVQPFLTTTFGMQQRV